MLSWKEKLSRLFSDSPASESSGLDQSQARLYSKESKSSSSVFSFIFPSSIFDGFRSNKDGNNYVTIQSPPVTWESGSISWQDNKKCNSGCENKEAPISHGGDQEHGFGRTIECENNKALNKHADGDPGSARSTSSSDVFEDATSSLNVDKSMPHLTEESSFISSDLYEFLQSRLPNIVKGCQWILLYSTVKHGISLRTLIRKSADLSGPCLLSCGDKQGAVFGGLLECPLKPTPKRKYQGTNQTFVFTTIYGEPRLFRPTGANRFFYMCLNDLLALGGGNFAIRLDGDLLTGTSGPCETFGNSCLAHSQEFELKNVELWGFTHSSRYLI